MAGERKFFAKLVHDTEAIGRDGSLPFCDVLVNSLKKFMSNSPELVCKPTKWFLWRAVAMAVMFGVGAFMFFKDWKWGYPNKNVEKYHYLAFKNANQAFSDLPEEKRASDWEAFTSEQKVFTPVTEGMAVAPTVPVGTDLDTPWPDILADYETYAKVYEEGKNAAIPPGWREFSNSGGRKWSDKSDGEVKTEGKIKEQLYISILCIVLFVGALFLFLRTMSRSMRVDDKGVTPAGGKLIPFGDIKRIDIRKWDTKGLAYLFYEKDGSEKKAKIDGMVYGQFKKEEGEPAQKLYERIMANFQGELIELAPEDEEEEENASEEPAVNDSKD